MITFSCPACGAKFRTPAGSEGKRIKCRKCSSPILIPGGATEDEKPSSLSQPDKPCPFCAELIKAAAKKCRFCGEMLDGSVDGFQMHLEPPLARSAACPKCGSPETSEYMPTRWMCSRCDTKFIMEEAPDIVLQPVKETVIHEGPTDTTGLEHGIDAISGVKKGLDASKGEVCPRCKSGYINPVGDKPSILQKLKCHNCGYTYEVINKGYLLSVLVLIGLVWLFLSWLGICGC